MWDRLLTNCHLATMDPDVPGAFGVIEDGAIGIQDGRIVRVGRRVELAGYRARRFEKLGGAWVTPGLVDCHTHLVFAGDRSGEFEQRLNGASYEDIARAGGGILSTVKATRLAEPDDLLAQARPRLHALMKGGVTTVEIKSGYGLDIATEIKLLEAAAALGASEPVRVVPTLLALHALPPEHREDRSFYVRSVFTPDEVRSVFKAAVARGLRVKLHAEQLSNLEGAALAADYGALSADHLEYADEKGVAAMAAAGMVAVLLPGAFFALGETRKPPIDLLRAHGVPMAVATDCNPGTSPVVSPTLMLAMACRLFGLTPEESLLGMTRHGAKALGLEKEVGTITAGKAADLCAWRVNRPSELCYWLGLSGPERRILGGEDA
jgi:imidazolonepropionase